MAKVEVRGSEIAYDIDGSGEPVVLIGGFTADLIDALGIDAAR